MRRVRTCLSSLAIALVGMLALADGPARSQDYPSRAIKIIVPLAPGGLADTLARIVSQRLAEASGQAVVVENRPGGAGAVGAEAAARAPADGYTLFMGSLATNAVIAHLIRLTFDPARDLVPITHVATFPNVLVVNPALPVKTVQELVAHAKANPGKLSYASQGNAASGHLVGEQFKQIAGIEMTHVPYRGAAPAIQDVIAGHVQLMFDSVTLQTPLINDRKTRALAVLTPQRVEFDPRRADHGRGRLRSDAERHLVRPVRAGRNAGRGDRLGQPRDPEGVRGGRGAPALPRARHLAAARQPGGICRAYRRRARAMGRDHPQGEYPVGVSGGGRTILGVIPAERSRASPGEREPEPSRRRACIGTDAKLEKPLRPSRFSA